jgi:hypothetical protein
MTISSKGGSFGIGGDGGVHLMPSHTNVLAKLSIAWGKLLRVKSIQCKEFKGASADGRLQASIKTGMIGLLSFNASPTSLIT